MEAWRDNEWQIARFELRAEAQADGDRLLLSAVAQGEVRGSPVLHTTEHELSCRAHLGGLQIKETTDLPLEVPDFGRFICRSCLLDRLAHPM